MIKCKFDKKQFGGKFLYRCLVKEQKIPENQELRFNNKFHQTGKTNEDVTLINFDDCIVTAVPQGLTKVFPNLKVLVIFNSKLKQVSKNDLAEYKNLEVLHFGHNEIEVLPESLFEGFENLKRISFYENKLKVVAPNILDELNNLERVNFLGNTWYNMCFSTDPNDKPTPSVTLDKLKADLCLKYSRNSDFYAADDLQINQKLNDELPKGRFRDIEAFIQDESTKDFKIIIESHEFNVHKFLLAARSSTLAEILRANPQAQNHNLSEIPVEIFEVILKFLYNDEIPGNDTNFLHLYDAAGMLKIQELKEFAAKKVIQVITQDNAVEILKLSNKYDHEEMRLKSFAVIKNKYSGLAIKDELALDTDKIERLCEIIQRKRKAEEDLIEILQN